MFDIGFPEMLVILAIALIVFGPQKASRTWQGSWESIKGIQKNDGGGEGKFSGGS